MSAAKVIKKSRLRPGDLRLQLRAHFYRLTGPKVTNKTAATLIASILRKVQDRTAAPIVASHTGVHHAKNAPVHYGFLARKYSREPAFAEGSELRERRYGLTLVVARGHHVGVYTAGDGHWSDRNVESIAAREAADQMVQLTAVPDARIEKVSSRNLSIGTQTIRGQSLEGYDLSKTLASTSLGRQILTSVRATGSTGSFGLNPTTALLSQSSSKVTLPAYLEWFASVADELTTPAAKTANAQGIVPQFLSYYARQIRPSALPQGVAPGGVLLDLAWLRDGVGVEFHCEWHERGSVQLIPDELVRGLATALVDVGSVSPRTQGLHEVQFSGVKLPAVRFLLRENKASYSLTCPTWSGVRIVAKDGSERSVPEALADNNALFVVMNDLRYAYAYGALFEDPRIKALAPQLAHCVRPEPILATCTSEKGSVAAGMTAFEPDSVFAAVEQLARADVDDFLVCDDEGDEWADFIGIRTTEPRITLYHAKHGAITGSASAFQEVVGQATKNLARLRVIQEDLGQKREKWSRDWHANSCSIARVRLGADADAVADAYAAASAEPNVRCRVCLVTSFTSLQQLTAALQRASAGAKLNPHEHQLIWLLVSFISECQRANAEPLILGQP